METVKIQRCTYISVAFLGISPPLSVTLLEIAVVYFCPLSVFAFSPGTEYIPLWRPYWYLLPHPTSLSHEKGDTWLLAVFNATLPLSQPCFFNSILPPWRDRSCVTAPLPTSCPWCLELQQGLDACVLCPLLPNLRKPLCQCLSRWVSALALCEFPFRTFSAAALKFDCAWDLLACKEHRLLFPTARDPDSVAMLGWKTRPSHPQKISPIESPESVSVTFSGKRVLADYIGDLVRRRSWII